MHFLNIYKYTKISHQRRPSVNALEIRFSLCKVCGILLWLDGDKPGPDAG